MAIEDGAQLGDQQRVLNNEVPTNGNKNELTESPWTPESERLAPAERLPPVVHVGLDKEIEEEAMQQIEFQGRTFNVSSDRAIPFEILPDENKPNTCKELLDYLNVLKKYGVLATRNDSGLIVVADD